MGSCSQVLIIVKKVKTFGQQCVFLKVSLYYMGQYWAMPFYKGYPHLYPPFSILYRIVKYL